MKLSDILFSVAGTGLALCALCMWCLVVVTIVRYFAEDWRDRHFGLMALSGGLMTLYVVVSLFVVAAVLQAIGA